MLVGAWIKRLSRLEAQLPFQTELQNPPQNPGREDVSSRADELANMNEERVKFQILVTEVFSY